MDTNTTLILATGIALLIGLLFGWLMGRLKTAGLREETIRLQAELDAERRSQQARQEALDLTRSQMADSFNALAAQALKHNSGEFLKLAAENLKQFQQHADGELAQREKAVENLVKPIREALEKTESQIRAMEKERKEAYGSLSKHLETMADSQRRLQEETGNLVQALRRPEVRGQWGEMTLKRLAELAGMVEHCDFEQQVNIKGKDGNNLRPDMVVNMPDGRCVVVDAKTPLDAYLDAMKATNDNDRKLALERHARKVRERVKELASKAYWQQLPNTPDFVVLFIPGDQFLAAAQEIEPKLLEDAMAAKVILATPTSLVALLRAVAYGWRQEALAENAEQIRLLGEQMYERLATFSEYLMKLGKSLDSSVSHFNKAVGSFDSRILPSARKFQEMGITAKKEMSEPEQLDKTARLPNSSET